MIYHATDYEVFDLVIIDIKKVYRPHWFELAKKEWGRSYKATGTPYSFWMLRGESYNRREFKNETERIIKVISDC